MKLLFFYFAVGFFVFCNVHDVFAQNIIRMGQDRQYCETNADCMLVPQSCDTSCETVPVNTMFMGSLLKERKDRCGAVIETLPKCDTTPPVRAICVRNSCTVDHAFKHHSRDGNFRGYGR